MLASGFEFRKLRPVFIPKKSHGERVICVPTVEDRLIQRAMLNYLNHGDKLRVANRISFGFRQHVSVQSAVKKVKNLRGKHPWMLKCDIQSFFDKIQRKPLKDKIAKRLGGSSIVPLLIKAVDVEIDAENNATKARIKAAGITAGQGLRQGMPLSPLLANFVLRDFDKTLIKKSVSAVRYADDLVILCDTEDQCKALLDVVAAELAKCGHTIDPLGSGKTEIAGPNMPVEFLGFDIELKKGGVNYRIVAPKRAFAEVNKLFKELSDFQSAAKNSSNFSDAIRLINAKADGFIHAYNCAKNFKDLESHALNCRSQAIKSLFNSIFGTDVLKGIGPEKMAFLDILDAY